MPPARRWPTVTSCSSPLGPARSCRWPRSLSSRPRCSALCLALTLAPVLCSLLFHNKREETDTIQGGQVLHTWDDLLGTYPRVFGVKTGHTGEAGWCQVAAVHGQRMAAMTAMVVARRKATLKAMSTASAAAMIRLSMAMMFIPRAW